MEIDMYRIAKIVGYTGMLSGFVLGLFFSSWLIIVSSTNGIFGVKPIDYRGAFLIACALFFFMLSVVAMILFSILKSHSKVQKIIIVVIGMLQLIPLFISRIIIKNFSNVSYNSPFTIKLAWISSILLILSGLILLFMLPRVKKEFDTANYDYLNR